MRARCNGGDDIGGNSPVKQGRFATTAFERLRILARFRRIGMVGLSSNPFRPSHFAAFYLIAEGYVALVNPREAEILGRESYPSQSAIPGGVEVVDIFREPAAVPAIVHEAIAIGATMVWMQLGASHEEAAERAAGGRRSADGPLHENRARALLRRPEHARDEHGGGECAPPRASSQRSFANGRLVLPYSNDR